MLVRHSCTGGVSNFKVLERSSVQFVLSSTASLHDLLRCYLHGSKSSGILCATKLQLAPSLAQSSFRVKAWNRYVLILCLPNHHNHLPAAHEYPLMPPLQLQKQRPCSQSAQRHHPCPMHPPVTQQKSPSTLYQSPPPFSHHTRCSPHHRSAVQTPSLELSPCHRC